MKKNTIYITIGLNLLFHCLTIFKSIEEYNTTIFYPVAFILLLNVISLYFLDILEPSKYLSVKKKELDSKIEISVKTTNAIIKLGMKQLGITKEAINNQIKEDESN